MSFAHFDLVVFLFFNTNPQCFNLLPFDCSGLLWDAFYAKTWQP